MKPTGYENHPSASLCNALVHERAKLADAQRQVILIEREMKRRRRAKQPSQ